MSLIFMHDDQTKQVLKTQGKSEKRGTSRVAFSNPAHLLDAAEYINKPWETISLSIIRNAFIKADLKMGVESSSNDVDVLYIVVGLNDIYIAVTSADL